MRRGLVRATNPGWCMVLRRAEEEQQQFYMELTLLLFYLSAMVLRQAKCNPVCSLETINLVNLFLKKLPTMELYDSKLYTPTISNYGRLQGVVFSLQQNCSKSILECFQKEMTVLVQETEQKFTRSKPLLTRLLSLSQRLSDKMHSCPECEVYKEKQAEDFLETLLRILQMMCSKNNSMTKSEPKR